MSYENLPILASGCQHLGDSDLVSEIEIVSTKKGDYKVMQCVHCDFYKIPVQQDTPLQDDSGDEEGGDLELFINKGFLIP